MIPPRYYSDCRYFRGDIPCKPHKETGVHCLDCEQYYPIDGHILIIKLGAAGDVIRTTPLLTKIKQQFPTKQMWWITHFPELVPEIVDKVLNFSHESLITLQSIEFDLVINLDKDCYACSFASNLKSKEKYGFVMKNGKPSPANYLAEHKFLTGLFDDMSKSNSKSYLEEIFEICGWQFSGEEYIIDCEHFQWDIKSDGKVIIGLNTGCGSRWTSRLWKNDYWIELARILKANDFFPILLGGEIEDEKNSMIADKSGIYYPGYFPLYRFISLVNQCSIVVTAVTMSLHIAIALRKNVVVMNNIFNKNEFELYGRGVIIEPEQECKCYFSPTCRNDDYFCMDSIYPTAIFDAIKTLRI